MDAHETRRIAQPYFDAHDLTALVEDVVYVNTVTGEEIRGREAVGEVLRLFYELAFDAEAVDKRMAFADGTAVIESTWRGRHVGEFAGIPATGKLVEVPICVVADVGPDGITGARLYMPMNRLLDQLGS